LRQIEQNKDSKINKVKRSGISDLSCQIDHLPHVDGYLILKGTERLVYHKFVYLLMPQSNIGSAKSFQKGIFNII
jgi:hypothetical protein